MTAEASEAKKYSTSFSSSGMNSEVLSERGNTGNSRVCPCGRNSVWLVWRFELQLRVAGSSVVGGSVDQCGRLWLRNGDDDDDDDDIVADVAGRDTAWQSLVQAKRV